MANLTYARNKSFNQLLHYNLPAYIGALSILQNLDATILNTSWELTLNSQNIISKNFSWETNLNLTIPANKVVAFHGI